MYAMAVMINIGIYILLALGLNIIVGYAGQPNIGQGAFFAIGAYSSAVLTGKIGINFWISLPLSIIITGIIGLILGFISIRIKEDFLAITTIALNFIVAATIENIKFLGGTLGLSVPSPFWFGKEFSYIDYFIIITIFILVVILLSKKIENSWLGLSLGAIRNNELAASSLTININKFKIIAFVIGTSIAGLAGVIYAHYMTFIMASNFGFLTSVTILSMVIFGGEGTIRGPIIGAIIITLIPEVFRFISDYRLLVHAILLILIIRFQPSGLLGENSYILKKLKRRVENA